MGSLGKYWLFSNWRFNFIFFFHLSLNNWFENLFSYTNVNKKLNWLGELGAWCIFFIMYLEIYWLCFYKIKIDSCSNYTSTELDKNNWTTIYYFKIDQFSEKVERVVTTKTTITPLIINSLLIFKKIYLFLGDSFHASVQTISNTNKIYNASCNINFYYKFTQCFL